MNKIYGIIGVFEGPQALTAAARHLRSLGFREMEAYTPYPVEGLDQLLHPRRRPILPLVMFAAAVIGAAWGYFIQIWDVVANDESFGPPPPPHVTLALLERGQQRFDIYCSPCHSRSGDGNGMIVQRGFPNPPSYFSARLMAAPNQHFYGVITHGYGAMFPYAVRVAPADRWAIIAYIRALQASENARLADVPADKRQLLQ